MSQQRVLPEDERRELRIWMRKKQRENYAVYQKHRQSLREIEQRPFSSSGTVMRTYICLFSFTIISILHSSHVILLLFRNQWLKIKMPIWKPKRNITGMYCAHYSFAQDVHLLCIANHIWLNRVLDHFNQRTLEACHLVNDTLASPPVIPGSSHVEGVSGLFTARPFTAPPSNNTYR